MTHPHDPYAISREYWERYEGVDIPLPKTNIKQEDQDPHSKRIMKAVDLWDQEMPEEAIRRARRAYFGACSYVDDQVGKLMGILRDLYLDQNTMVVFCSDHGDMLGERGLWYKMSYLENSSRIPLLINYPSQFAPRRVKENVSTMDLLPTLVDIVGGKLVDGLPLDGKSFYPALHGHAVNDEVIGEYMGEGTIAPLVMIKRGSYKFIYCPTDPYQLFDLATDPLEHHNLATSTEPKHQQILDDFVADASQRWDMKDLTRKVIQSQRQRRLVWSALRLGAFEAWDYQPIDDAKTKYIRSTVPLDELELKARYPPVDAMGHSLVSKKVPVIGKTTILN
jgi:choline-sulfatase